MNGKRIITFILLAVMILSACSNQSSAESSTPTLVEPIVIRVTSPTATGTTATIESSVTSTTLPEFTATPEPPRPTNEPGCTNSASFITDVTIPDNSEIVGDTVFTKTWRVTNTGTCIWASDYTLTHYAEERMNAPASVPLDLTYPGQSVDISVPLTAPNSVGTHKGYFVIKNPAGLIMKINSDSRLWLIINVKTTVSATATAVSGATSAPAATTGSSGNGFANVTCAYTTDQAKVNAVVSAVNAYRAQSGLPAYNVNPQLTLAAQAHANDMACNNLFVHTGSNGSTVDSRVVVSGYTAAFVTENVYGSYPPLTGQEVVNWWKNDKTDLSHNRNLVSDTYIEIGVGYAFFNNYGYYVIVFATP